MKKILTPEEMRLTDERFIKEMSIPGIVLMEHAALGVVEAVLRNAYTSALIIAGAGNNGADGLSVLRQLAMRGIASRAYLLCSPDKLEGNARAQYDMALSCSLDISILEDEKAVDAADLKSAGVIIDALFGTGLSRPLEGRYLRAVERINASDRPVVAVDIPSGIDAKTGAVLGAAVKAVETVTFQYAKRGHMLTPGRAYAGRLTVAPIAPYVNEPENTMELFEPDDIAALLPERAMDSHKGSNGRALLIAGSADYTGAAIMCASSALRSGAGLLHAAVPQACAHAFSQCPAAICHKAGEGSEWSVNAAKDAALLLDKAQAIAIGPGMGAGAGVSLLLSAALETKKPIVIDADALNALASSPELFALLHENSVLTPHPGEMARLLHVDKIHDPVECATESALDWGCKVLLKGASSVIASSSRAAINIAGNTGLAKGGSGDVLTGIILAFLAQGMGAYEAACAGAYMLGASADEAFRLLSTRMLLPTDVISALGYTYPTA